MQAFAQVEHGLQIMAQSPLRRYNAVIAYNKQHTSGWGF